MLTCFNAFNLNFFLDPDICDDGLSFEMTLRMDKEALKYNDMNYIVDSGASTFKSKGFTLYTLHGNLRADLAIANQEYCLQIPLIVDRWQDILVTWNKSEGKPALHATDQADILLDQLPFANKRQSSIGDTQLISFLEHVFSKLCQR